MIELEKKKNLSPDHLQSLFKRHYQGALIRSVASLFMWLFAILAFIAGLIKTNHFVGVSISVLYLIVINPPTLLILKHIKNIELYAKFSILINILEIIGYTTIIYFLGGIEATYLTPIYAALIIYVGATSPRKNSFIVVSLCAAAFTLIVLLEGFEFIPTQRVDPNFDPTWQMRLIYLSVLVGLLFVVAYISSVTAGVLKSNRDELRRRNLDLEEKTGKLQHAENELRNAHNGLENRVEERTAELAEANKELELEIAERKLAELSLRESHETLLTVLDSIDATIYVADMETYEILFLNEYMKKAFGGNLEGKICWEAFRVQSEPCKQCSNDKLIDSNGNPTGVYIWEEENPITKRWYINFDRAIKWVDGRWVRLQIATDISKIKELENKRFETEAKLQRARKMEAIGILAGGVAHDLNNILSGIVSYPELILLDLPEGSPLKKPILTIQKAGEKAAVIVQDLLTLARRGVAISEVVNLNHIITTYLKSPEFEKMISFHLSVQVETTLGKDLLNIKGSTTHLSKSIMNLISNAAEAMPDGGKILISTVNRYIDELIQGNDEIKEGDYIIVTVSDTGTGISSKDLEKIFEPFYTKKIMGKSGTGLGMAVVWGTVKDHDGYVEVESTEGIGTAVRLYFPATREDVATNKSRISMKEYIGSGESILIVDDVEGQREIVSKMLRKLGYSVSSVSSGEKAVDTLKKTSVDLLLLDMIMNPGIDGLETYERILELHPNQKAIITSGYSETERVKKAMRFGVGKYIKKPYTLEKIGQAIKEELIK